MFLGDNNSNISTLDQGADYYYAGYADAEGYFNIEDVRTAQYGIYAWSNGGSIANISTTFAHHNISVQNGKATTLGNLTWEVKPRKRVFQIGDLDHKTLGFRYGGAPYQHGLVANCPANLTYTIGSSNESEWCFGQSALGSWTVLFDIPEASNTTVILSIALAGYSKTSDLVISVNGQQIAQLLTADLLSDPGLYRSGTTAGEWRNYEFDVSIGVLRKGSNNLVFQVTNYTLWRGFMWDSVSLDWSS